MDNIRGYSVIGGRVLVPKVSKLSFVNFKGMTKANIQEIRKIRIAHKDSQESPFLKIEMPIYT